MLYLFVWLFLSELVLSQNQRSWTFRYRFLLQLPSLKVSFTRLSTIIRSETRGLNISNAGGYLRLLVVNKQKGEARSSSSDIEAADNTNIMQHVTHGGDEIALRKANERVRRIQRSYLGYSSGQTLN
ncbi:hypothetical protein GGU11DRAFT_213075 [Lentinula aff. detonsa]|nr:hypothetical protein GGU11DRAFT_213075 [Lentinula aff. detonsa]